MNDATHVHSFSKDKKMSVETLIKLVSQNADDLVRDLNNNIDIVIKRKGPNELKFGKQKF
ncbi:hypothetical protein [Ileibacterium valens]|uniref:hypothetical protein n=1 Tax=Ileibacterium valens TaxID=1862668 RepID=UPI002355EE22|nr:hypothetical protein [Ileibacterium valens]